MRVTVSTPSATIEANAAVGDDPMILRTDGVDHLKVLSNGHMMIGDGVSDVSGRYINTSTGAYLSTGGTWANASSRDLKTNFESVSSTSILSKLATLDILTWNYKNGSTAVHLGPIAEDFRSTFGLGHDSKSISTVDADGVALAVIQALYKENEALKEEVAKQKATIEKVLIRLEKLEASKN